MVSLPPNKRKFFLWLIAATLVVMIGMLYFGIRLKGFRPGNNVQWLDSGAGLAFDRFGEAYVDGFFQSKKDGHQSTSLAIEFAINAKPSNYSGFSFLVLVHDGDDRHQLVIGQWRSSLMIMNGDDYSHKLRVPKIYFELNEDDRSPHLFTIVSDETGTRLFIDGVLHKKNDRLVLRYPKKTQQAKLVVGNSLNGNNPWTGTIMGLSFYDNILTTDKILQHFQAWNSVRNFGVFKNDSPRLLYTFEEGEGDKIYNIIGNGLDLNVPSRMQVLQMKVLSWPKMGSIGNPGMVEDILINFAGFVPLGFLLLSILSIIEGFGNRTRILVTILFVFSFSLFIEIAQVWIPSRDSSMLDLIMNTFGGAMGIMLFKGLSIVRTHL